ncbi:MAG: glycosyltransferase [Planctomycetia bacterium]|nr:glycosyltransferase [Planctomycetia bacterium]
MATYLIFSDDWGRHPSSCQHLTRFLLRPENRVLWVNTIGTRPPRLDWLTAKRGFEKVFSWMFCKHTEAEDAGENGIYGASPTVHHPMMWPWFRHTWDRKLNRWFLRLAIRKLLKNAEPPILGVTTLPIVADVMTREFGIDRWVYYCVDDWSLWPGMDSRPLAEMEKKVVQNADVLIAAGTSLQKRLAEMGRDAELLTHGVDLDFWRNAPTSGMEPVLPAGLEKPYYTFWGLIDERLDLDWIRHLSDDLTRGTLVFSGPFVSSEVREKLERIPRTKLLGFLPYAHLPRLAAESDVLLMPYRDIDVTRQMQPLKMTEYLVSGLPTVVRDLPATREWADAMDVVDTAEAFSQKARKRAEGGLPEEQKIARKRVENESWRAKSTRFEAILRKDLH